MYTFQEHSKDVEALEAGNIADKARCPRKRLLKVLVDWDENMSIDGHRNSPVLPESSLDGHLSAHQMTLPTLACVRHPDLYPVCKCVHKQWVFNALQN